MLKTGFKMLPLCLIFISIAVSLCFGVTPCGQGQCDFSDLVKIMENWLIDNPDPSIDIAPCRGDGIVDIYDFVLLSEYWLVSKSSQPANTYNVLNAGAVGDGVTDCTAAVQSAVNLVYSHPDYSGVYFPPGYYRITNDILLKDGVSLRGDYYGLSVIQTDSSAEIGNSDWSTPVTNFRISDLHFVDCRVHFYGSVRNNYSISRCTFLTRDTTALFKEQLSMSRSNNVLCQGNIFMREVNAGPSPAFNSYRSSSLTFKHNIIGLDLASIEWLRTEWASFGSWHNVIGKLQRLKCHYGLDNDLGWFHRGVNIHTGNSNIGIVQNIFNCSPNSNPDLHHDHIMYIHNNESGTISILGNWMRGWPMDSSGAIKIRNNGGPVNVVANHFVNSHILGYIHDNSPRIYNNTLVYRNRFTIDDFSGWSSPINYWNQIATAGSESGNEFAENIYDTGGWGNVNFRFVTNPSGFTIYNTNIYADTGEIVGITEDGKDSENPLTITTGAPDEAKTKPFDSYAIPMLSIPEYQ